ncbi:hypothetical protein [Desulfosporosinus metallidurans]|uniref:Uncharacterized protein n=1 Tax=Desulfosporosinus metallidurans TaxID=1888891 RepID=A0A1Q8QW09_9FIRM|nr:hypothetical protein [Desulfosporosinus metallidurans]OLN31524.1 hypothetical protein DSOL_2549 [Desulfosporosinus metallidurans]
MLGNYGNKGTGTLFHLSVAKLMHSRELLNVYLGNSNIPVKVFKIDLSIKNSVLGKTGKDIFRVSEHNQINLSE